MSTVDILSVSLFGYILLMIIVSILILLKIFPHSEPNRKITLPNRQTNWKCVVKLSTDSVFSVNQPIHVSMTLEPLDDTARENLSEPDIILKNAKINGREAAITLSESEGAWSGEAEVEYHKPGIHPIEYLVLGDQSQDYDVGQIAPESALNDYNNNRYILLFAVVTSIFAAASLITAIQSV